jgi:hypothetical protein
MPEERHKPYQREQEYRNERTLAALPLVTPGGCQECLPELVSVEGWGIIW